ncbi:Uncharacterized protein SCF082_LOCUS5645 [Durusdinium trenchii]|uniref:Uncharacterized protein n=1 Tax=Durusdinium trenchii TaxID=1381693 RepID=A0ABP0I775_9DINO
MGQDQNAGHGGERDGRHDTTHAVHRRCQIHFGFGSAAILEKYKDLDLHAQLDREVKIMEDLRERFYCTGSTLEVYRQGWSPQDNCGVEPCPEPPIYLPNGFAVTAFAVSYVHKELLDVGSQSET